MSSYPPKQAKPMKDPVRIASAVVYFRILRGLGHFQPLTKRGHFIFRPCLCTKVHREPMPFELPGPVSKMSIHQIVAEFDRELGALCSEHYHDD